MHDLKNFKTTLRGAWFHVRVLVKGLVKALCGAAAFGLGWMGVHGYTLIPTEGGYAAVCDFIASTAMLALALMGMYLMGGKCRKTGKK
jgi:hypothetical protein